MTSVSYYRTVSRRLAACLLLLTSLNARSQRAYPIDINTVLTMVPIASASAPCYEACTKTTDPANGAVSIKDNGAGFKALQDQFDKITKAAMADFMGAGGVSSTPPTPEQIEQMKQQALAKASQRQSMPSGALRPEDIQLMKLIGNARSACNRITQISSELNSKLAALDHSPIEKVSIGPKCPEVMQGGYAGPTCACQVDHATSYETKRVAARNELVQQANTLLTEYIGKLKPQIAIVDDAVAKAKYGDAISNPAFKQQVVSLQRQALAAVSTIAAFASSNWEDAAKQYAGLVNAKSGSSTGCYGRK